MGSVSGRGGRRRGGAAIRAAGPAAERVAEVVVESIGSQGDGIAEGPSGRLFIAGTIPGERVRARVLSRHGDGLHAEVDEILSPAAGRVAPRCRHFGRCGGCSLQHLDDAAYAAFKLQRLRTALARAGLDGSAVGPLVRTPPGGRRRARFAALGEGGGGCVLGFRALHRHVVVDLAECPVLDPAITAVIAPMRGWLGAILGPEERAEVAVARLAGGLDVVIELPRSPTLAERESCARFAAEADIGRLSWRRGGSGEAEPIVRRRPVGAVLSGVFVDVPPGAFLQASDEGEAALVATAVAAATGARTVVDLFAGVGTFAIALAGGGRRVLAIDGDGPALAAAVRAMPAIATQTRDLLTRPLSAEDLRGFDAAVFDPPRAGAAAQAKQLGASGVPVVVAVSCNPETFARDARLLAAGGYALERVVPVDQFLWSAHLELAAVFRKDPRQ